MNFRLKQLNPFGLRTGLNLGIDISEREVRGVLLMQRKEGAQVIRLCSMPVDTSPNVARSAALVDALKALLKEFSLSRVSVSITLQPSTYFVARYHFSGVPSQKIGELVLQKLEEEKLPFAIEDATISYAPQPRAPKGTYIAVCIERSRITPIFSVLHGAGVSNFFLLPPDMSVENCLNLRGEWPKDETIATLRTAAHETVLTFYDQEGFRLRRIIPIGLKDLFKNVFSRAEGELRRNQSQGDTPRSHSDTPRSRSATPRSRSPPPPSAGVGRCRTEAPEQNGISSRSGCSLDPAHSEHLDPSDPNKQIFDSIRPVLRRLASSIKKTFHFYETHVSRSSVSTLYLVDDFENLLDIDRFLTQSLQVETRYFKATDYLTFPDTIQSELKSDVDTAQLTVALGNAIGEQGEISLVPKEELFLPRLRVIRTVCRLTAAVLCLTMALLVFFYRNGYDNLEQTADYSDTLAQQLQGMQQKETMVLTLKEQSLRHSTVLGGLLPPEGCLTDTLKEAGRLVPDFVLIDSMELHCDLDQASFKMKGTFALGEREEKKIVWSDFVNPLEASPYLENISLLPGVWEEKGTCVTSNFTITGDLQDAGKNSQESGDRVD